jgi:CO/xanthine dehydrogenase Mo-binding subunit
MTTTAPPEAAAPAPSPSSAHAIGSAVPRKEGRDKVTGAARYIDDMAFPGCLHGVTVRSPIARGKIRGIRFEPGVPWEEITVVTAKDIPGENKVAVILYDQPILADGVVNHAEEPVVLLAHPDARVAEEARRRVVLEIDPLPAVLTIDASLRRDPVVWGEDNVFKSFHVEKGDVDAQWAGAARVVEGVYETGAQEQLYIEPNGCVAKASPGEGITVWGSLQCPYYVHKGIQPLFKKHVAPERIRVIQAETGGGFGGKEEYPTLVAGHAALLSWKAGGRPVKIVYDRAEDMAATTKRHPSRTRHRTAVAADGRLLAMEVELLLDGGAYCTLSPVVLSRGTLHACGPYRCEHQRVTSKALATNHPPHGAFRGFGAPQSLFALERHMEKVARAVGLTGEELRRRNFVREGDTLPTGQVVREAVDMPGLLDTALREIGYREKAARFARENDAGAVRRGVGFACFMHGAGFTGSGETMLASKVAVEGTEEGRVRVLVASTEIGQGTNTVLAQIAADALGVPVEQVECLRPDTDFVPNSGPTVASRTCMVVGKLVEDASKALEKMLVDAGRLAPEALAKAPPSERGAALAAAIREHRAASGGCKAEAQYRTPPHVKWDDATYKGDAYGTYAWAVYAAEVEVDTVTYEARCTDFVAVQEVGKVIHPVLAAGQIEGGVAQAVGFALSESVTYQDGRMVNNQMTNYIMPTSADVPRIRVFFAENPYPYGPHGAKGIGELPMDGPAPAIVNAVEMAIGAGPGLDRVPLLPEAVMAAMEARS